MITREFLLTEARRLAKRREQLVADLNGTIGAEEQVTRLLKLCDEQAKPAEPAAPAAAPQ